MLNVNLTKNVIQLHYVKVTLGYIKNLTKCFFTIM